MSNLSNSSTNSSGGLDGQMTKLYVLATIIILTLIGNGLIMVLVMSRRESTMTRVYYFMFHLSIADVITAFLTLLPEFIWTLTSPNFYGGTYICKAVKFLQMVGPYLSSYVLAMTALDRYQAICFPLTNQVWTSKKQHVMIAAAWIISTLLCIPQAFIFSGHPEKPSCNASFEPNWGVKAYVTWFSISNFFVPLAVLIFTNACICVTIWRTLGRSNAAPKITINLPPPMQNRSRNGSSSTNCVDGAFFEGETRRRTFVMPEEDLTGISRAKMRSVQQTVVIILTYVASSTPFIFAQLWAVWGSPSKAVLNSMVWLFWLLTLNSVVNPWIYLAFNGELRAPIRRFFMEKLCLKSSDLNNH